MPSSLRTASAGSTRSASTCARRHCSRTAPTSSGSASSRPSCATRNAGASCSASPAPAATSRHSRREPTRDGDDWIITGQKVWTTWAHISEWAVLLARTDPDQPKRKGITYFLIDLRQPGVDVRQPAPPDGRDRLQRGVPERGARSRRRSASVTSGTAGAWRTPRSRPSVRWSRVRVRAGSTASVAPGSSTLLRSSPIAAEQMSRSMRQRRRGRCTPRSGSATITNQRVRAGLSAGRSPGAASSVGKMHIGRR